MRLSGLGSITTVEAMYSLVWRLLGALVIGTWTPGCASPATSEASPDLTVQFSPASAAGGGLYLAGRLEEGALELQLWAQELDDVFGWNARLQIENATVDDVRIDETVLQGGEPQTANHLVVQQANWVALGSTRLRPNLGGIAIGQPTQLGTVRLSDIRASTRIEIVQAVVRSPDGSLIPTSLGDVEIVEVTR